MCAPWFRFFRLVLIWILPFLFIQSSQAQNSISLPPGQQGTPYFKQITTEGGLAPLSWKLAGGELPPGMHVSGDGKVEGKPTAAKRDTYSFTVSVSDSSQPPETATMQFLIVIHAAPLRITGVAQEPTRLKIVGVAAVDDPTATPTVTKTAVAPVIKQNSTTDDAPNASIPSQTIPSGAGTPATDASSPAAPQSPQNPCVSTPTAYFPEPPVTGRKVVSGCAGQARGARVVVYRPEGTNECPASFPDLTTKPWPKGVIDNVPATVDLKTGIFQAELANALSENELICPYSVSADQNPPVVTTKWGYEEPTSFMGRTRYYLSTGVELSQDNQQFSNQDLYLGFALDRNWIRGAPDAWLTILLNSEFSAQLASIPVAASSTTTTNSTTSQSVSTFITSRKAAVVGGDIYVPLYFRAFKGWFGSQTTAFFAPIIKGGLQTITSGALSASTPAPGTTTTTTTVNSEGLYYFWGMGIRLGDLKLHRSWNVGPEILSHLDLTFGQWQNFEQCKHASNCTPGADGTVPSSQLYQPWLLALEGQFNVPKTPVIIGFKATKPMFSGGGQGDLRFYFGVKLDVGCIYKSFKGGTTPSFLQCTDDQPAASDTNSSGNATPVSSNPATAPTKNPGVPAGGPKNP
jgi:hypothetical protein